VNPLLLHTTRGPMEPSTLDGARALHNAFVGEGPQPGIEIARSLGDVSHQVYRAADGASGVSDAEAGELLFVDFWTAAEGMEAFFANPFAGEAGDRLYSARAESEWHPAPGAVSLQFPAATGAPARFVVLVRAPVHSAGAAVASLDKAVVAGLGAARRRGQLSHQVFVRDPAELGARPASNARHGAAPRATPSVEVLAMSTWPTLDGLLEHHRDPATAAGLEQAVAGPVAISVWEQAGGFVEW
jgi:hypothetical protein